MSSDGKYPHPLNPLFDKGGLQRKGLSTKKIFFTHVRNFEKWKKYTEKRSGK